MNSDSSETHRSPLVRQLLPDQDAQPADRPFETSSFVQERDLISLADPEHQGSFSLDNLRSQFPDPAERVEMIWWWLSNLILDYVTDEDRREPSLAMLDELVEVTGFSIRDSVRLQIKKRISRRELPDPRGTI